MYSIKLKSRTSTIIIIATVHVLFFVNIVFSYQKDIDVLNKNISKDDYGIDKIECDGDKDGSIDMVYDYIYNSSEKKYIQVNVDYNNDGVVDSRWKLEYNDNDKKDIVYIYENSIKTVSIDYIYNSKSGLLKYKNATHLSIPWYAESTYNYNNEFDKKSKEHTTFVYNGTMIREDCRYFSYYNYGMLKKEKLDSSCDGTNDTIITYYYKDENKLIRTETNDTSTNDLSSISYYNYNSTTGNLGNYTTDYNASGTIDSVCYTEWKLLASAGDDSSSDGGGDDDSSSDNDGGGGGCLMNSDTQFNLSWLLLFVLPVFMAIRRKS